MSEQQQPSGDQPGGSRADTARDAAKQAAQPDAYADPPRSLIALHPHENTAVAVVVGAELRVLDRRTGVVHVLLASSRADATCLRGVAFDPTGQWLAAGGDDKCFRVWSCQTWECTKTFKCPKKISAVAFSKDGSVVLAADKFGDVLVACTAPRAEDVDGAGWELLLGHYCSLLTCIALSSDGRLIATTDRDMKLRISVMPSNPMAGAHSIQSYCFGHTSFVTCAAFARAGDKEIVLSGGGDGSLRMWHPLTGAALCTLELGASDGDAGPTTVLAVAAAPGGRHAVVVVDGRDELALVALDIEGGKMELSGWCTLPGLLLASDVCFDADGTVWAAGGPPTLGSVTALLACGAVGPSAGELTAVEGAGALTAEERQALEARDGSEAAASGAARRSHLAAYLRKKEFTQEEIAERKKRRMNRDTKS